jgi:hypothetical protein
VSWFGKRKVEIGRKVLKHF